MANLSDNEKNILNLLNELLKPGNKKVIENFLFKKGIESISIIIKSLPLPARQLLSEFIKDK